MPGKLILVVDDNAANRRVLQLQPERNGCEVHAVSTASDALATLRDKSQTGLNFDAILSDLHMPDTDGLMLARSIHSLTPFREIPICLLCSDADREHIKNRDIAEVLVKPVREASLLRVLNRVFFTPDSEC